MDIGESLVGSFYRQLKGCHSVLYNTFLPHAQGEIDVIALRLGAEVEVFAAEVAIHLESLQYGTYEVTTEKVTTKMVSARTYCEQVFRDAAVTLEFWSPVVPKGLVSSITERGQEHGFALVANDDFTERMQALIVEAAQHTKQTGEPAYRMLQLLTHLRGHDGLRF